MRRPQFDRTDFDNLTTGDEIHLTSGEVWSVVEEFCGPVSRGVKFALGSFAEARENGGFFDATLEPAMMKEVFWDAIQGGARVVKGAGLNSQSTVEPSEQP